MCWNQYVSLNTFVFGVFVLLLIAFNNKYSQYKIPFFKNIFVYFFFMSFISMQFIEFLLWRNLDNKLMNKLITYAGYILLVIQPIASLFLLDNVGLRNKLIFIYLIPTFLFFLYQYYNNFTFVTNVTKTGHLKWDWGAMDITIDPIFTIFTYIWYLGFGSVSFILNKYYWLFFGSCLLFIISYYCYFRDGSAGSLWCWMANSIMLIYLIQILIYLPYKENGLC